MLVKIKSCPFCGGEAERFTIGDDEPSNAGGDVITCTKCGASSHVEFGRKENLVSRWNTRTQPAPASGEVGQALVNCAGIQSNGGNGDLAYVKVFFKSAGDQDALFVLLNESLPTPPAQGEG